MIHLLLHGLPADVVDFLRLVGGADMDHKLGQILTNQEKSRMNQTEELALLQSIDDATTKTGGNVQKVADTVQTIATTAGTISDEIDALLAGAGVPPEVATKLTAISGKVNDLSGAAQASSDALDAQVPVLQAIATKGAANPVPVPVPPPPAV